MIEEVFVLVVVDLCLLGVVYVEFFDEFDLLVGGLLWVWMF